MTSQDERYIRIAKACLRAINQVSTSSNDREKDIQNVYKAIDEAFRKEFEGQQETLFIAEQALTAISSSTTTNLEKAKDTATLALDEIMKRQGKGIQH